jgi:hypothetical protein
MQGCGADLFDDDTSTPDDYNSEYDNTGPYTWPTGPGSESGSPNDPPEPNDSMGEITGQLSSIFSKLSEIKGDTGASKTTLGDIHDTLQSNNTSQIGKLNEIKDAINGLDMGVSMAGVESRLDVTNTKLGEIKDKIPQLGGEALPDGNTTQIEDNSVVSEDEVNLKMAAARNFLDGVLDWWMTYNPFNAILEGVQINASGSPSMSFNWGKYGTSTGSGGSFEGPLSMMGSAFVAMAALMGLVAVLRD